jgi:AGZA family xanthine/uracil permease-like MFS transporter
VDHTETLPLSGKDTGSHQAPESALERWFKLKTRGTTVRTEAFAGTTTFMAAAYLVVVIPGILASGGMDLAAVTTATIVMFFVGTLGMALYANLPFVVGPGIGGAAIVATTLAVTEGVPWQTGMAIAMWSGVLFLLLTLLGMREVVTQLIPAPIKLGLSAALGGFVAMLGFRNAGLVVANLRVNALSLGDFSSHGAIITLVGLAIAIALRYRKIPGAILLAIILATLIGLPLGVTKLPGSFFGLPHGLGSVAFKLNPLAALKPALFPYLFAFFAAEFFSTMGTTLAVGDKAGMLDEHGNMPGINGPFVVDSCAATIGPLFGVPAMTALIESATGVEAGGRTGLANIFTAVLFLATLLFSPLILMIPKEATAPALILVGLAMFANLRKIDLGDLTEGFPAILMVLITLFANNFGTGIAAGILSYVIIKILTSKAREVSFGLYLLTIPLLYFFWTVATRH